MSSERSIARAPLAAGSTRLCVSAAAAQRAARDVGARAAGWGGQREEGGGSPRLPSPRMVAVREEREEGAAPGGTRGPCAPRRPASLLAPPRGAGRPGPQRPCAPNSARKPPRERRMQAAGVPENSVLFNKIGDVLTWRCFCFCFNAEACSPIWSMPLPRWNPCFPPVLYFCPRFSVTDLTPPRSPERLKGPNSRPRKVSSRPLIPEF